MPLPTAPTVNTVESMTPDRLRAVIYGAPGAGKTTLASGWYPQSNLIIDLEGGTRFLPGAHFVEQPKSLGEFRALVVELMGGNHQFTTLTIDTGDGLLRMADGEAGGRHGQAAAALVDFGKGLADRDAAVLNLIRDITLKTDLGLIICAHPADRKIPVEGKKDPDIITGPRIDPNDRITQEIEGLLDYVLHIGNDHVITSGGNPKLVTKRRVAMPDQLPADAGALFAAIQAGTEAIAATPVAA